MTTQSWLYRLHYIHIHRVRNDDIESVLMYDDFISDDITMMTDDYRHYVATAVEASGSRIQAVTFPFQLGSFWSSLVSCRGGGDY